MSYYAASYKADLATAKAYYALVARANDVGVPTSLDDDPASPSTVAGLEAAVAAAEDAS